MAVGKSASNKVRSVFSLEYLGDAITCDRTKLKGKRKIRAKELEGIKKWKPEKGGRL